ncbi:hypothetical protein [Mangrovimonas cancribranchiae]|uniref:Nuclear transport factor 2 family protein n=1 Tax=Mangrovimonas cancribranchiae TaxID=3080055 RepID=A0AAU6P3B5_9FLAO
MKHYLLLFIFISSTLLSFQSYAQNSIDTLDYSENVSTLDKTINTLYQVISGEKGEARNWPLFKHLFKPNAKLIPSGKRNDSIYGVRYLSPDDYINTSGQWLVDNGFFEKEIHRKKEQFGNITHIFSTYEAYKSDSDETPFMRGINSIQLLFDGTRWWIINIYWTQETPENPIPNTYLRN